MKKYLSLLRTVKLFSGIEEGDLLPLLDCLGVRLLRYGKGETIFASGDALDRFGIILSGQVQIVQDDYYGNRSILSQTGAGQLFGEAFAFAHIKSLPVSVITTTESEVMMIGCERLLSPCPRACSFHGRMIQNLLGIVAMKNIALTRKIEYMSKRTTREKLLAYLSAQAAQAGSSEFTIAFDRQELADYLSVERSAMSAELSKLRRDGILVFHKNYFKLL